MTDKDENKKLSGDALKSEVERRVHALLSDPEVPQKIKDALVGDDLTLASFEGSNGIN